MFSPIKFFNPTYLFELRPYTYPSTIRLMLIFFVIMLIVGIALKLIQKFKPLQKYQEKAIKKYASWLLFMSSWGLLLTWFKYERIQVLAARFWLVIWLVITIGWLVKIYFYQNKTLAQAKKQAENRQLLKKYLPKK